MPISDGRNGNKRSASERGTPAWEALKSAIYLTGCRMEYAGRIGESDEFTHGGAAGAIAHLEKLIDPKRSQAEYWGDVLDAMHGLEVEARAQSASDGALW